MKNSTLPPNQELTPVFLRLPSFGPKRSLWPGSRLNYWKMRSLISPGPWNDEKPPVRAYELRRPDAKKRVILIEHGDLLDWLDQEAEQTGQPLLSRTTAPLPAVLTIPPSGGQCFYTQLKHTVMYNLSLQDSPYGQTGIYASRYILPGRKRSVITLPTTPVLEFIRSLPAPRYSINPGDFESEE